MRVLEEMVRVTDGTEPEVTKGGGRAKGHEGWPTNRVLAPQLRAYAGIHPHDVPWLRARHLYCHQQEGPESRLQHHPCSHVVC